MIYLDSPFKSLMITLDAVVAANQLDVTANYYDITPQSTTTLRRGGVQQAASNNTSDVTFVSAPALQGIVRNVQTIFINNKDTATRTVTVKLDDNGAQKVLVKQSIAAGESLVYEDNSGWQILSPITPPFVDTTPIVHGSSDTTKQLRIEVDGLSSSTTRVWTALDADLTITGSAAAMTTGRVVYTTAGGLLTSDANFTYAGSTVTITNPLTVSGANATTLGGTLAVTGTITQGNWLIDSANGLIRNITAGTTAKYFEVLNTGNAGLYLGVESSVGGAFFTGSVAYESVLYSGSNNIFVNTPSLRVGSAMTVGTTLAVTGHTTFEGVTSTGATGTGNIVYSAAPTFTGTTTIATLALTTVGAHTISGAITYGGVTLNNAVTGTGNMVLSASPTLSGTVGGALTFSGALTLSSALTYGGVTLSNAVTGTGNMVLSASPALSGSVTVTGNGASIVGGTLGTAQKFIEWANTGNSGFYFGVESSAGGGFFSGTNAYESVLYSTGNNIFVNTPVLRIGSALSYGGVTLSSAVTGTGNMVLSAAPTFSGNPGGTITSGTYSPTYTSVGNVASSTGRACQYMRVGNTVTVSGAIDITSTSALANTRVGISLPVASNFANAWECAGTVHGDTGASTGDNGAVYADATNDRAELQIESVNTSSHTYYFHFTYQII